MPQAALVPIFTAIGAGAATAATLAAITQAILINVALSAISRALYKKPKVNVPPVNVTVRNPIENRRVTFGTRRVGGSFIFYDTAGVDNKELWYVVANCGHQSAAQRDVWLDTQKVSNADINGGDPEGGPVSVGTFADKLEIWKHDGSAGQNVDPRLDAAFPEWTTAHRLRGISYLVVKMTHDPERYPQGAPNSVTTLMDGALLYDSRLDSTNGGSGSHRKDNPSTWEFGSGPLAIGRNPILQARWVITGGSVHNDKTTRKIMYGLRDKDDRIEEDYFAAAANDCDEILSGAVAPPSGDQPRYRCDIELSTGETRRDWLEDIMATCAGALVPVHGRWRAFAGVYHVPAHTFTEKDLYGQLEVEDTLDHDRRWNKVAGVYCDVRTDYGEQTTIFRTDAAYETQDGGEAIPTEIDLRGVTDQFQAQRLAEIKLRQSRMMRIVKLVGAYNLMRVAPYETLTFSHARFGWTDRTFRLLEKILEFHEDAGRVSLTCQREDAAVYADLLTADYTSGTSDTDVFRNETPSAPSGLHTTAQQNGFLAEFTAPSVVFPGTTFESRTSAASSMSSPTTVYLGPDLQFFVKRTVTTVCYVQIRAVRNGIASNWYPLNSGIQGRAASIQTALSASVSPADMHSATGAASQTTNIVTVTPVGGTAPYTYSAAFTGGGSGLTINNGTTASPSVSATGLASGELRARLVRITVTDNVAATFTVDVPAEIERPAAAVTAPIIGIYSVKISPTNASCAFRMDSDGHVYSSNTTAIPTTDRGTWSTPVDYAADYAIRVTRTGGSDSNFTSGPALNTWLALSTDREWRLTESFDGFAARDIEFTIEIRRVSDSVVVDTTTGNLLSCEVEL